MEEGVPALHRRHLPAVGLHGQFFTCIQCGAPVDQSVPALFVGAAEGRDAALPARRERAAARHAQSKPNGLERWLQE